VARCPMVCSGLLASNSELDHVQDDGQRDSDDDRQRDHHTHSRGLGVAAMWERVPEFSHPAPSEVASGDLNPRFPRAPVPELERPTPDTSVPLSLQ
jgi:hypothetical protein